MNKFLTTISIVAAVAVATIQATDKAFAGGIGNNYIAPAVTFGGGSTAFGVDSKIGIADHVSLRPYVIFPSGGTSFGSSLTYDWDLRQSATSITPFLGLGLDVETGGNTSVTTGFAQVGADLNVSDQVALVGSVAIPFNSNSNNATSVTLGAGLRF
jgi:opacity protein-like surface antigen